MTGHELPRRPYAESAPPPDGLSIVRRDAARRRRHRLVAVSASGATVVAAAVFLGVAAASGDGLAILRPEPPAASGVPQRPSATPAPGASHAPTPALSAPPGVDPGVSGAAASGPGHRTRPIASPTSSAPTSMASYRPGPSASGQIVLTRSQSTYAGPSRVCGGSENGSGTKLHAGLGWCITAVAQRISTGERLTVDVCRDQTSGGTLTFAASREVDLAVTIDGRTVWDWARDHPGHADQHQLSAGANGCWDWTLVWPGVSQDGSRVQSGTYMFVATSTAEELQGHPTDSVQFTF